MNFLKSSCVLIAFIFSSFLVYSQTIISGRVTDDKGAPLLGVTLIVNGTSQGAVSDVSGNFKIDTGRSLPLDLRVSYAGYTSQILHVTPEDQVNLLIELTETTQQLDQVIVSASRYEQRSVTTPVTIEKINLNQLITSPTADFYESFGSMRGVQANTGSMVFTSFNTRGFADPNNLRYIQQLDGMDLTTPGFGVIGNTAGVSSLDIAGMELLPGSASALYGADAFNGILLMFSKDAFETPGLSAEWKTGFTKQDDVDANAYNDISIRYAHVINKNIAFKLDINHKRATDWAGTNLSNRVPEGAFDDTDAIVSQSFGTSSTYNAVNRYGGGDFGVGIIPDVELTSPNGQQETLSLARTGLHDRDVFDGKMENYRINGSLHFKVGNDWKIDLSHKFAHNDFSFRITTFYPFQDFQQTHSKLEAKNDNLTFRIYRSAQKTNKTYLGFLMARTVESGLKSDEDWTADFREEYAKSGDLTEARAFADRDLYDENGRLRSELRSDYDRLFNETINNTNALGGGAGFLDNSSYIHSDLLYDFKDQISFVRLQLGANARRYNVDSEGTFFNDNQAQGYTSNINYYQIGMFAQATKHLLDYRMTLNGSVRYDKNENYEGNFTPRISVTYGLDKDRDHNLRASYQTAFRNPGLQESFNNFNLFSTLTILGSSNSSLEKFTHVGAASGENYSGTEILDAVGFKALEPEKNSTLEAGYRGLFNDKLLIDVNIYHTWIPNFITLPLGVFSPDEVADTHAFLIYQNLRNEIATYGSGISAEYDLGNNFRIFANYNFNDFYVVDFDPEAADNLTGDNKTQLERNTRFNSPTDRIAAGLSNSGFGPGENIGFNVAFRATNSYFYQSSFGETTIPAINNTDVSLFYDIDKWDSRVTLSATNVFRQDYSYVYGGGVMGSTFTIGFRYTPNGL